MHALGHTHAEIATRYKISVSASWKFKQLHRAEIEARQQEIFGALQDWVSKRCVADTEASLEFREYLIETTLQRREEPDLSVRDYSKLNRDIDHMLYKCNELAGPDQATQPG